MRDIDHTHPHTGEPFGKQYYETEAVAADGGREERDEGDRRTETMADVDHDTSEGTVRSFQRGTGREDTVEHE